MQTSRYFLLALALLLLPALLINGHAADDSVLSEIDRSIRLRDYQRAVDRLQPLLAAGSADAQYRMAAMYRYGRGVSKSLDGAVELYRQSAMQGHADAQYTLASILDKQGERQQAMEWFERAAQQGQQQARRKLAMLADSGSPESEAAVDDEAIFSAILHNRKERIRQWIEDGRDFNILDPQSRTPLMSALMAEHEDIARWLLPLTTNLAHRDLMGSQAIHVASSQGYQAIVKSLIEKGVDVNAGDGLGNTPLMLAVRRDDNRLAEYLLKKGAKPGVRNRKKKSVIDIAVARNHGPMLALFRRHDIRVQEKPLSYSTVDLQSFRKTIDSSSNLYKGWPVLNVAALLGEDKIVSGLLRQGADVNARDDGGYTALHRAAGKGNEKSLDALVAAGADLNAVSNDNETPLYLAARSCHVEIVRRLLALGAHSALLTAVDDSALRTSIANGCDECAALLTDKPLDRDPLHRALRLAVQQGWQAIALRLLERDVALDRVDDNGRGILWLAADGGQAGLVAALLEKSTAGLDRQDINGYTPLARAVMRGEQQIARLLVERKAELATRTNEKNSLLMLAVLSGREAMVDYVAQLGIDIDARNNVGDTALMLAASRGEQAMVERLIDKGADLQVRNRDDLNAYMIARNAGHPEIASLIRAHSGGLFKIFN